MDCLERLIQTLNMQLTIASANHVTDRDAYKDWEACQSTCTKICKVLTNYSARPEKNPYLYSDLVDAYDKLKLMIGRKMFDLNEMELQQ